MAPETVPEEGQEEEEEGDDEEEVEEEEEEGEGEGEGEGAEAEVEEGGEEEATEEIGMCSIPHLICRDSRVICYFHFARHLEARSYRRDEEENLTLKTILYPGRTPAEKETNHQSSSITFRETNWDYYLPSLESQEDSESRQGTGYHDR